MANAYKDVSQGKATITEDLEVVIGRVICHNGTPTTAKICARIDPSQHPAPGRIYAVKGKNPQGEKILILVRVEKMWEHNPHEDALSSNINQVIPIEIAYAKEGQSTVIYRAFEADTLEEISFISNGKSNGEEEFSLNINNVTTLPRSGWPIIEVSDELISKALELAPDPDLGLDIGHIHTTNIPVRLKRDAIQTHLFICGGIGRGKSYARGVIAEEYWAHRICQINIDPMGEMVEATKDLGGMNIKPGDGFTLPLSALQAADVVDAIPGHARSKATNIFSLIKYAHDKLLDEKVSKLGQEFGVTDLVKKIEDVADDIGYGAKGTLHPALLKAKSLSNFKYIGDPFDWKTHLQNGKIINIDCRGYSVRDLRLITASIARDIQRLAKKREIPFVVFSMDEAHLIAPNDDNVVTTQVLREIARIGRHYRIGLIMTTQSPADMDKSILKRLLTRMIFAIESDQLQAIRGVFSDAPDEIIKQLPKLPKGTCLLTGVSETIKHAILTKVRTRKTTVGGSTPNVFSSDKRRSFPNKEK